MQQHTLLLSGSVGVGGVDGRVLHEDDVNMEDSLDDAMDGGDVVVMDASSGVSVSAMHRNGGQGLE